MNPNIELNKLMVMQDKLRHTAQIAKMVEFVKDGGFWTQEVLRQFAVEQREFSLIVISKFEDNMCFVHDGNHRCVATYLGERKYLRSDEYIIKNWKYEQYMNVNFNNNWYTPFDPRTHNRLGDLALFKEEAKSQVAKNCLEAEKWIFQNTNLFCVLKGKKTIKELASNLLD